MSEKTIQPAEFLHQRDPSLHITGPVSLAVADAKREGQHLPNNPTHKIDTYLARIAARHSLFGRESADADTDTQGLTRQDIVRQRIIETFVIDDTDVPDSYFASQARIARERGQGDVVIRGEEREQMTAALQADQRASLGRWVEYLGSEDATYPTWFKYYAFKAVTGMAGYNKETQSFGRRTRGTVGQFPDLDREALAYVYDSLEKHFKGQEVDDEDLQQLLISGNFAKLYAHAIERVTPASAEQRKVVEGSWKKYDQGSDSTVLAKSLQGHGTGWCTAGEATAETHLSRGDFYVWYSNDQDGNPTVPRIAIRMQSGRVEEVRGIDARQELEATLIDTAMAKVVELPGGEAYLQKAEDMKRLTALDQQLQKDPNSVLSDDNLLFLYEVRGRIQGFGADVDPRISELQHKRDRAADFRQIHAFIEGMDDAKRKDLRFGEDFMQTYQDSIRTFELCQKIAKDPKIDLEIDELRYLYELDRQIPVFARMNRMLLGHFNPDLSTARLKRDARADLSKVFGCKPEQVATDQIDLTDDTVVLMRGLMTGWHKIELPKTLRAILGDVDFVNYGEIPDGLELIVGRVNFTGSRMRSTGSIKKIVGNVFVGGELKDLGELEEIIGSLDLDTFVVSAPKLKHVSGDLMGSSVIKQPSLEDIVVDGHVSPN